MGRLDGKVAIVTGAGQGIGRASALALAAEGARVVVSDIADAAGEAVVAEIGRAGGDAIYHCADVGLTEDVQALVEAAVAHYGRLDVYVNNAGIAVPGSAVDISEDDWTRVINVNLSGMWRGIKFAIPQMVKTGGGSIINMASVQALMGFEDWAGYAAAKGGVLALTQQVAVEYGARGIRVNAIAPGTIMTPMNEKIFEEADDPEELASTWNSWHALGRFGQPGEVAQLVVFLASDESSFITGTIIKVDGGLSIKGC